MSISYPGNGANVNPALAPTLTLPADGESRNAASVDGPMESLADYVDFIYRRSILQALNKPEVETAAVAVGLNKACWFNTAGLWVVVGNTSASIGTIQTSLNLVSYTSRTSNAGNHALYGADANSTLCVAVGQTGTIVTSPDGVTWTARTSGSTTNLGIVKWIPWLNLWIACSSYLAGDQATATGALLTSPDGITWTVRASGVSGGTPYFLNIVDDGSANVVISGRNTAGGVPFFIKSTNGTAWTQVTPSVSASNSGAGCGMAYDTNSGLWCIAFVPSAGTSYIATSPDLATWTTRAVAAIGTGASPAAPNGGIMATDRFIMTPYANGTKTYMLVSFDGGVTWSAHYPSVALVGNVPSNSGSGMQSGVIAWTSTGGAGVLDRYTIPPAL